MVQTARRAAKVRTPTSAMASSSTGPAPRPGRRRPRWNECAGFTLLELIVVFSVMAVMLGLAPIAYDSLMEGSRYRGTVRNVLSGLASARQLAAQTGRSAVFSIDLEKRIFGPEGRLDQVLPESIDVRLVLADSESTKGGGSIRFYPDGGSTGGSIDVFRRSGSGVRLRVDWLLGTVNQEPLEQ